MASRSQECFAQLNRLGKDLESQNMLSVPFGESQHHPQLLRERVVFLIIQSTRSLPLPQLLPHLTQRETILIDSDEEDQEASWINSPDLEGSTSATRSALSLRCLICSSLVYAVSRALPPAPTRSLGFFAAGQENGKVASGTQTASPSRPNHSSSASSQDSLLRPANGTVWLLPGCTITSEEEVSQMKKSEGYSETFGVVMKDPIGLESSTGSSTAEKDSVRSPTSRPGFGAQRKSSFGPLHMSAATGLPSLPLSLFSSSSLATPPRSPSIGTTSLKSPLFSPTLQASSISTSTSADPLLSHIDSVGLDSLRKRRGDAENEIAAFISAKRRELEGYEKSTREQGEKLLALGQAAQKGPKQNQAFRTFKTRNQSPKTNPGLATPKADLQATPPSHTSRGVFNSSEEPDESLLSSTLPSSVFERRRPLSPSRYSQSITTPPDQLSAASSASGDGIPSNFKPSSMSVTSQSLSALSASFAMRGRDPPQELEAWANKRRLMERYPEGDHSALNSAEPSGDERSEEDDGDGEEEGGRGRGRGRDRGAINAAKEKQLRQERERERLAYAQGEGRSLPMTVGSQVRGGIPSAPGSQYVQSQQPRSSTSAANKQTTQVQAESEQEVGTPKTNQGSSSSSSSQGPLLNRGRSKRTSSSSPLRSNDMEDAESVNSGSTAGEAIPSTASTSAPFAPGSLSALSKAPALTRVDTGPSADDKEAPRAGGILSAHPEDAPTPSAEVTLRPRPPPENSSAGSSLKPAVKGSTTTSSGSSASTTKKSKKGTVKAKKVAFAETTEKVEGAAHLPEEESEGEEDVEEVKNLVDESEGAVFDIDEEVDQDETEESDGEESSAGHQALSDLASDPAYRGRSSDSGDDQSADSSDEDKDLEVAASMASVGSLSALANQQNSLRGTTSSFAGDFDPASLRLDGRVVDAGSSLAKRGVSSFSHLPSSGAMPLSEGSRLTDGPSGARIPMAIGEAEARLSGLLAPQAPSHRGLWTKSGSQSKKKNKYQLGADDDEKWEAWQQRGEQLTRKSRDVILWSC